MMMPNERALVVDSIASHLMAEAEKLAPMTGDPALAEAGSEALISALIRRVGPFSYSSNFAELIPASSRS
jgi:hypothetical protein